MSSASCRRGVPCLVADFAYASGGAQIGRAGKAVPMTYDEFNAFCGALRATTYVMQWGGSHVWKVGGKVFAIGGWREEEPSFTFKVSWVAFEMLKEQPG